MMEIEPLECSELKRGLGSWMLSVLLHSLVLVLLALWVIPGLSRRSRDYLDIQLGSSSESDALQTVTIPSLGISEPTAEPADLESQMVRLDVTGAVETSRDIAAITRPAIGIARPLDIKTTDPKELSLEMAAATSIKRDSYRRPMSSTDELREAGDAGDAVGTVAGAIRQELAQGDTLVVWLLDASVSLASNRQLIAVRMEQFYRSIDAFHTQAKDYSGPSLLLNAVVAYGASTMELMRPNRYGARVCDALYSVPADSTGLENVMSAVSQAAYLYRVERKRRERILFVVVTDESGDDTAMLEPTIDICRRAGIAVHVIGPTAVFGAQRGSHLWQAQDNRGRLFPFLLPVNRGPDTSLPERAFLPYWHESLLPPWQQDGAIPAKNVPWYGGAYRERVLSGVGPYALTRLALTTGGTFTIVDRQGDAGPFRLSAMREYLPSFQPAVEYLASIQGKPIREAVSETAALSHQQVAAFVPPRMAFLGQRAKSYPFDAVFSYVHPMAFRARVKPELARQQFRVMRTFKALQTALLLFEDAKVDWEYEYGREESRRWRAWYDLTKGRLLALSVRCLEYNAACELVLDSLSPGTNKLLLRPWSGGLRVRRSVEMADEAERLLVRCRDANPGTPWEALARWELETALGIQVEQGFVPPPPPPPVQGPAPVSIGGRSAPQTFSFPNL